MAMVYRIIYCSGQIPPHVYMLLPSGYRDTQESATLIAKSCKMTDRNEGQLWCGPVSASITKPSYVSLTEGHRLRYRDDIVDPIEKRFASASYDDFV